MAFVLTKLLISFNPGRSSCDLLCKAEGFGFFDILADKVTDGTPCKENSLDVCIDGACQVKNLVCVNLNSKKDFRKLYKNRLICIEMPTLSYLIFCSMSAVIMFWIPRLLMIFVGCAMETIPLVTSLMESLMDQLMEAVKI